MKVKIMNEYGNQDYERKEASIEEIIGVKEKEEEIYFKCLHCNTVYVLSFPLKKVKPYISMIVPFLKK